MKAFKQFLLRGNVIDLAVAVVMGAAFGTVVTALVKDLITPLVAAIFGQPDFSSIAFTINGSRFAIGDLINAVLSFVLIGTGVYLAVVLPMNRWAARRAQATPAKPAMRACPECQSDIAIGARRCPHCTSIVNPATQLKTGS